MGKHIRMQTIFLLSYSYGSRSAAESVMIFTIRVLQLSYAFLYFRFDPVTHQSGKLLCVQILVFLVKDRLQVVDLYRYRLTALLIQNLIAIHQCHRDYSTPGLGGTAEAPVVELQQVIGAFAPGTLGENQVITSAVDFLNDGLNDSQGLAHILPIHGKGLGTGNNLLQERNILQFLF